MELKDTEREYADWADEEDLLLQQADAANAPFRTWLVPDVCDMDQCVKSWFLPQILQEMNTRLAKGDLSALLRHADLSGSDLSGSDLRGCDLIGSNLRGCNLIDCKHDENTAFYDLQCPEEGDFIAFKKASGKIVKLRIPAEARRSSATTRKCRAEFADVLEILNFDKSKADVSEVASNYNKEVIYKVGERVTADSWDDERWKECSYGIHFFITFDEAVNY